MDDTALEIDIPALIVQAGMTILSREWRHFDMKAAVLHRLGDIPRYEDFPDPVVAEGDVTIKLEAVTLDYAVKVLATGTHFASKQFFPSLPAIVGHGGVGSLEDGSFVSFQRIRPPYGSMAETVAVPKAYATPIPQEIDAAQAAVIPSAASSSLLPLRYGAKLQAGETVLINGATSVSGMLAVKIAKSLGAGRVVGTGRNLESGEKVKESGADAFIDLNQPDEKLEEAIRKEAGEGYDVILDYLWGHPAEVLIRTFTPTSLGFAKKRIRFILIGMLAGRHIQLPAESVITSGLEINGFGVPNTPEALKNIAEGTAQVWDMIKQGTLRMDIVKIPLKDIEEAWELEEHGKRIVIIP
jgi:NADPH:quinone reductase-like Zn-dependent oxidoreductase